MKTKIESFVNVILILLLPIMSYVTISQSPVNISFADLIFPLAGLFIIIQFKRLINNKRWVFIFYFLGTILSLVISHTIIQKNEAILSVPYMSMVMELIKTAIVGGYFYIGYMFVINIKRYKVALYALSIGSIPIGMIAVGAYISFVLDKPFFIEAFMLEGPSGRLVGTFEDPNLFAFYLIMIFYISLWNSKIIQSKLASFGMILISAFSIMLLVMTMSRSGWIAFAGSLVVFVFLNIKHITRQSIAAVVVILCIIFIGIQVDYSVHEGKIVKTVMDRVEDSLIKGDEVDRFQLTEAAFKMGNDNFVFGVGKGNFPLNSYLYLGEDNNNYKNQYIPHNTLMGVYAQQGIFGFIIFLMLPIYLLYRMIKSKRIQNRYLIPLLAGFVIQSFAINVENVRFLWFLIGILLASTALGEDIKVYETKKWNNKSWIIGTGVLFGLFLLLYINTARYVYMNIAAYRGKVVEKTLKVHESGIYTLSFDIQTNGELNRVEVYEKDKLLKSIGFKSAYGKVEEKLELKEGAKLRFISDEEGWMKIRNAHIIKEDDRIPLYSYLLVPGFIQNIMNQKGLLVYAEEPSFKQELDIARENTFEPFEVVDAAIRKYSNLSSKFEIQILYKGHADSRYHLQLSLQYDSISDLFPGELQRNTISHAIAAYPVDWKWEIGEIYTIIGPRLLTSTDFKLYGRFYDIDTKSYPDERFFEIPYKVIKEEQEIISFGENQWINIRYGVNEEQQIVMSHNSWVESKRYALAPGNYKISFKAQGHSLENEYSKIRIRDSYLNELTQFELDETSKIYAIPYTVSEKEEGMSFILELINFKSEKDVGDRRVLLEDWIKIERVD